MKKQVALTLEEYHTIYNALHHIEDLIENMEPDYYTGECKRFLNRALAILEVDE